MYSARVVVLDENRETFSIVDSVATEAGARQVRWGRTVDPVRDLLRQEPCDLLLVDQHFGGRQGGIDLIRDLRADGLCHARFSPIVLMVAQADAEVVRRARDAGVNSILVKPFSRSGLLKRLVRVQVEAPPFIETADYRGPDRRRAGGDYTGPERRVEGKVKDDVRIRPPPGALVKSLVVDDSSVNRSVLAAMLWRLGVRADQAGGAEAALRQLALEPYDRLFVDIHMPEVNGVDLVRRVREGVGPNRDVPIIAVTADVTLSLAALTPAGFDGFISKPITLPTVRAGLAVARRIG